MVATAPLGGDDILFLQSERGEVIGSSAEMFYQLPASLLREQQRRLKSLFTVQRFLPIQATLYTEL